ADTRLQQVMDDSSLILDANGTSGSCFGTAIQEEAYGNNEHGGYWMLQETSQVIFFVEDNHHNHSNSSR
ncbi:hypothetical protein PS6_011757, partial [Mucor atramentarius]